MRPTNCQNAGGHHDRQGKFHQRHVPLRYLNRWILPRWETTAALGMKPLEVEQWLKFLHSEHQLENTTLDKMRSVMNVVYKHGQRYGLIPREDSANPMRFVRCKTTSDYIPVIVSPEQAFDILLNIKEPGRRVGFNRCGYWAAHLRSCGTNLGGRGFRQFVDLRPSGLRVWPVRAAEVEGFQKHRCQCIRCWRLSSKRGTNRHRTRSRRISCSPVFG